MPLAIRLVVFVLASLRHDGHCRRLTNACHDSRLHYRSCPLLYDLDARSVGRGRLVEPFIEISTLRKFLLAAAPAVTLGSGSKSPNKVALKTRPSGIPSRSKKVMADHSEVARRLELWVEDGNGAEGDVDRKYSKCTKDVCEIEMDDFKAQEEAVSLIGLTPWILLRCKNWTMIPLENLVASAKGTGTSIACAIDKAEDVAGAAFALQIGVDAILLPELVEHNADLWARAREIALQRNANVSADPNLVQDEIDNPFVEAILTQIESVGLGERICIDLIETLEVGEGCCIGSCANLLALVHGETIPSNYVPTRPFRVNAGPVSSYILMADGKTKYLNEIKSGDQVLVARAGEKTTRSAGIGRVKIERRPFLKIAYENVDLNVQGHTMLQQAETVRLVQATTLQATSVTDLTIGDKIVARRDTVMRHVGIAVQGGAMSEK